MCEAGRQNLMVIYYVKRDEKDHHEKQVPYTSNNLFMGFTANNRSLFLGMI